MTNLFISSEKARHIESSGSRIYINFDNPLRLQNATCRLLTASAYYDMPNVITGENDKIEFIYAATPYTFTLNQGLYSIADIMETLNERLINSGIPKIFEIQADESTSLVSLRVSYLPSTFTMDFDVNNGVFNMLGFSGVFATASGIWVDSGDRASLNQISTIFVHASWVTGNYFNSSSGSDILGVIPINVAPSHQLNHEPFNPFSCDVTSHTLDTAVVYLTNEKNEEIITREPWTLLIEFTNHP